METADTVIKRLTNHPAADEFPMMSAADYKLLRDDIKQRGMIYPIVVMGDQLLDGRNRLKAAKELGVTPRIERYKGSDPVGEVISRNIQRRHLTDEQRVAIVAKLRAAELEAEGSKAKGRKAAPKGTAATRLAKEAKTTTHKAKAALAAAKHAPEELEGVIAGKVKLAAAQKVAKTKKAAKDKASGKTRKAKTEATLEQRVAKKFLRFMESFTVAEYADVRKIVRGLVAKIEKEGFSTVFKDV